MVRIPSSLGSNAPHVRRAFCILWNFTFISFIRTSRIYKISLVFLNFQHPLVYENAVQPAPLPEDWFHSTIVVQKDSIIVYVDHSAVPSLRVRRFDLPAVSGIGLLTDGLSGDFANLVLKKASSDK